MVAQSQAVIGGQNNESFIVETPILQKLKGFPNLHVQPAYPLTVGCRSVPGRLLHGDYPEDRGLDEMDPEKERGTADTLQPALRCGNERPSRAPDKSPGA